MSKKVFFAMKLTALLSLTSCAGMLQNRSFIDEMDNQNDEFFVAGRDFPTVPGDSGSAFRSREEIQSRTPASASEMAYRQEMTSIERELYTKEAKLTPYQQKLYSQAQGYLTTSSEKIYFLNLSDSEKREYLDIRSMESYSQSRDTSYGRGLASLQPVYSNTLTLGMSKDQVMESWGRPSRIDVAGNPNNQNERWAFYGNGGVRYIYFESGRVQGWNVQ